jgi:hypothetical protein
MFWLIVLTPSVLGVANSLFYFYPVEITPVFKGSQQGNVVSNRPAIQKALIFLSFVWAAQFCSNVLKYLILQPRKLFSTEFSTGFSHMLWIVTICFLL